MPEPGSALRISCVCFPMCCSAVCSHLYSDWVWIMLSVLYNLEYCMQNGPYWLCHGAEYKKGSAQAYTDNPLRKQRPAGSSNEYKTPHKSQALAWHPALVLSCLRQWEYAGLWWKMWGGLGCCLCLHFLSLRRIFLGDTARFQGQICFWRSDAALMIETYGGKWGRKVGYFKQNSNLTSSARLPERKELLPYCLDSLINNYHVKTISLYLLFHLVWGFIVEDYRFLVILLFPELWKIILFP